MTTLRFASSAPTLTCDDVERFSRQIMVEGIGAQGMARIRAARVVCVGAGGLGSTIALYLAAAGVGTLTLVDFDSVELSNLHRQVIHTTANVGRLKVESARDACLAVNPSANIVPVAEALAPHNAIRLLQGHDVVLDGSDNVAARYLVNDAAMALGIPLVSGSAMRWDGQLSVYGYNGGPCYRCLFPSPPPAAAVGSCNDTGVMGPVPGLIGCLQALEALKVVTGAGEVLAGRLFVFDGLRFSTRVVTLRGRQPHCQACGVDRVPPSEFLAFSTRPEYTPTSCLVGAAFSRSVLLEPRVCVDVQTFASQMRATHITTCLCVDVRAEIQFGMAHLTGSHSLPLADLEAWKAQGVLGERWESYLAERTTTTSDATTRAQSDVWTVFVICRRGVASARATRLLLDCATVPETAADANDTEDVLTTRDGTLSYVLRNVDGGLNAFHREVDRSFPFY